MKNIFKISYRIRPGSCRWRCYTIKGLKYHLAIPITKWVFKIESPKMWIYIGKNVF